MSQDTIIKLLKRNKKKMTNHEISKILNLSKSATNSALRKLRIRGDIKFETEKGWKGYKYKYFI